MKPAIFDLFLAAGIACYIGLFYLAIMVSLLLLTWSTFKMFLNKHSKKLDLESKFDQESAQNDEKRKKTSKCQKALNRNYRPPRPLSLVSNSRGISVSGAYNSG